MEAFQSFLKTTPTLVHSSGVANAHGPSPQPKGGLNNKVLSCTGNEINE